MFLFQSTPLWHLWFLWLCYLLQIYLTHLDKCIKLLPHQPMVWQSTWQRSHVIEWLTANMPWSTVACTHRQLDRKPECQVPLLKPQTQFLLSKIWVAISILSVLIGFCFYCFLAQDVIYTSHTYATMSVSICLSVCDGSALVHYS